MWEKENKLRRRWWQSKGYANLKQQANNPAQIASHGLHLHLRLLRLFLLLTSFSPSSLSSFRLHCYGFRFSPSLYLYLCWFFWILFFCFQGPFTWLALGKKKTFNFWIKDGKMFQPLDFCSWAHDVTIDRLICDKHLMTVNLAHRWIQKKNQIE